MGILIIAAWAVFAHQRMVHSCASCVIISSQNVKAFLVSFLETSHIFLFDNAMSKVYSDFAL